MPAITNLGGLAAGYNSYLQQQFENNQKAQYLALLQQEEARKQQSFDQTRQDASDLREANIQNLFSDAVAPPAPQPGQASIPGAQPLPQGARPAPMMAPAGGGEGTPAGVMGSAQRELSAIQNDLATKPLDPRSRQMLQEQAQMLRSTIARGGQGQATPDATAPMPQQGPAFNAGAAPAMPAGGNLPQAPQMPQQGAQDPVQASLQILAQTSQQLQTPAAQRIASDGRVQAAQDAFHNYVKELQAQGINPISGQKPDGVQSARLMLLHAKVDAAATDAAKSVTEQDKNAAALAEDYVQVWTRHESAMATVKAAGMRLEGQRERAEARGAAGDASFDEMTNGAKRALAEDYARLGPSVLPWSRSRGQGGDIVKFNNWRDANGYGETAGTRADYKAEGKAEGILVPKLRVVKSAYDTFDSNYDLLQEAAKKYNLGPNQPLNSLLNAIRTKSGDEDAQVFQTALNAVQREYGRLMIGSTGVAGTPMGALKDAEKLLTPSMTLGQLNAAAGIMRKDGNNVVKYLQKQVDESKAAMRSSTKPAADTGGDFKARNGKTYTSQDLQGAAEKMGITVDELKQRIGG